MAAVAEPFNHPALFYAGVDDYLAGVLPFVTAGLAADEPVLVAVPGENLDRVRAALGADAARVALHDMSVEGRNPGRIIPAVLLAFAAAHQDTPVRVVGEPVWAGRTATEYPACALHEALINAAFAGRAATILCPYDTVRLDPGWLRDAELTHPVLCTATGEWASPRYRGPFAAADRFNVPLPAPPPDAAVVDLTAVTLPAVRRFAADRGMTAGLPTARIDDLVLVVSELAANSMEHARSGGTLAIWIDAGRVISQVTDEGHITDPLAGRVPVPAHQATRGRGLLLVNQLCDLVRMHTRQGGTTIRIHVSGG